MSLSFFQKCNLVKFAYNVVNRVVLNEIYFILLEYNTYFPRV